MGNNYRLTKEADAELESILSHTQEKWGTAQMYKYAESLDKCFNDIGEGKIIQRTFAPKLPGLLVKRCEKHFVFYFKREKESAIILNILHGRMDLMKRMTKRLQEYSQ
jgi:toxin ParE1/3/4